MVRAPEAITDQEKHGPAESEEFGYGSMTLKGEKYVQAAALAAVKNGQTDIEGRCACLHVVDEEAAESLRRKVGEGRLNCKPGALPRNSLPRPAGFFIPGITLGCRNPRCLLSAGLAERFSG